MHQRPAAMGALDAAQIVGDLGFEHRVDRLAEIVPQQNVFGRDGAVGLELEHPMAVGLLQSSSACVADAMLASKASRLVASRNRMSLDCSDVDCVTDIARHGRFSGPFAGQNQIGGAVTGPDRSLDRCRQSRISPVAGEEQVFQRGRPAPDAGHSAPASPQMWRGARARSARAAARRRRRAASQTSLQIACASSSRGMSTSRSPLLMVTESRCGNANSHSTSAADDAQHRRRARRRIEAEMRVDDGAEFRRRLQAGQQRGRRARRHRHHDGIVRRRARSSSSPKFSALTLVAADGELAQLMAELQRSRPCPAAVDRRLDQHRAQARRARSADGRPDRPPAASRARSRRQARPILRADRR